MEGSRGDLVLGKNRGFIVPTKGQHGLRGKGAGGGVVRTCGNSLPLISVFLIKLFPVTQNTVCVVGLMLGDWCRVSFAEAH